jgi:hypothetical protein
MQGFNISYLTPSALHYQLAFVQLINSEGIIELKNPHLIGFIQVRVY